MHVPSGLPKFQQDVDAYLEGVDMVDSSRHLVKPLKDKQAAKRAAKNQGRRDWLRGVLASRYTRALIEPGEAVGVTAAQSIGEPSTQMTLNTFHHAGSTAAHVTEGIPRLRQLLMTGNVPNPIIRIPITATVHHPQVTPPSGAVDTVGGWVS